MRNEPNLRIEQYRVTDLPERRSPSGVNWGLFFIPVLTLRPVVDGKLIIISSGTPDAEDPGAGWEHVSVSFAYRQGGERLPSWGEMQRVKELFWRDDETVVQFHPRADAYVNLSECLHLWKRVGEDYQLPPRITLAP